LLVIRASLFAAGPIVHILTAEIWLQYHSIDENEHAEFILGTLFPDIHYIKVISREKTHDSAVSFEDTQHTSTLLDLLRN